MGFWQAVHSCFNQYATFSGRASRSEFWYWTLFCFLVGLALGFMQGVVAGIQQGPGAQPSEVPQMLVSLVTLLPGLAVTARRLHDTNRSGWWMLIGLTIIGIIPLLIWYCTRGTPGDNRYGPDPLAWS